MKVLVETPNRLVVVERPWVLSAVLVVLQCGLVWAMFYEWPGMPWPGRLLLVGWTILIPAAGYFLVHWVRVEFDKTLGRVTVTRTGLGYRKEDRYPLDALERVRVDGGEGQRIVLEFNSRILAHMQARQRLKLLDAVRRGFRILAANEVALTQYFSEDDRHTRTAGVIRAWTGVDG